MTAISDNAAAASQELADRYGLTPGLSLENTLSAIDRAAYGDFSPEEADAPLRRQSGSELLQELRSMAKSAAKLRALAGQAMPGALELACADYAGSELMLDVRNAINLIAAVPVRDEPIKSDVNLAVLVVGMLFNQWVACGGARQPAAFSAFVADALYGRRAFPTNVLQAAVAAAIASWRGGGGDRRYFVTFFSLAEPPSGWVYKKGFRMFGGVSGMSGEPAKFAEQFDHPEGAAAVAEYISDDKRTQLMLVVGSHQVGGTNKAGAFTRSKRTQQWAKAQVPEGFELQVTKALDDLRLPSQREVLSA